MRTRTLLAGAVLLATVVIAGCETAKSLKGLQIGNVDVGELAENLGGLREVSQPEEIEIGRGVTETLLGAAPLADDPELQRYVNALGTWIAQQSERPDLPWSFAVNNSPVVNAVATPGGNVIVTTGMLRVLRSESELAGVLGHEVAHAVRKHHLDAIRKSAMAGLVGQAAQAAAGSRNQDLVRSLVGPTKELYTKGLDRSDEFEADRMGVVLAARAGYDPWGLPAALQQLGTIKADDDAVALLFQTHPAPSARLDKLGTSMGTQLDDLGGPLNAERYQRATQRIRAPAG